MKKTRPLIVALLLQLFITLGLGSVVAYGKTHDRAPAGLIVWGQDYSGMSRIQVSSQIKDRIPNSLLFQEQDYPLKMDRSYEEIDKWLDQVFQVPTGFWFTDIIQILSLPSKVIPSSDFGLNREDILAQLQALSAIINKPMVSAMITYSKGQLVKTDGQAGQEVDIERTWLKIASEHEQKQVALVVNNLPPQPDLADISRVEDIIGDYTTYFNSLDVPRTKNVRLAAMALNNQLIPPGQIFSFNDVVGERTEASGYLPALIFVNQTAIKGDGGGICQDSSTLYQAVRQAHLSIVERHTHTLPVSYVLKGQDATVSFGILDFRFRNDTQGYLLISARTGSNWLRIQLFGLADEQHPVLLKPAGYPSHPEEWNRDPK
ncbi:vanomycin resistance protein VanB [Desulfosporosinus fructosivorans]|uniref:Vanomycin resistance protein VanB n=1 Tax=Desulfosporosinus fructosivorans TaxID=2018669 RepID=A0A4Z0R2A7_9FIRM|nr:VanW family protein [Desulfosporosinus fructosivorans]TGE36744.1 vanomycin resistance protein VanB [Desulfosporosinus fructosivorans]